MQPTSVNNTAAASAAASPDPQQAEPAAGQVVNVQLSSETPQTVSAQTAGNAQSNSNTDAATSSRISLEKREQGDKYCDDETWYKLKSQLSKPLAMIERARSVSCNVVGDDEFSCAIRESNLRLLETKALLASIEAERKKTQADQAVALAAQADATVAVEASASAVTTAAAKTTEKDSVKRAHIVEHGYYGESCKVLQTNVVQHSTSFFEVKQTLEFEITVFAPESEDEQGAAGGIPLDVASQALIQQTITQDYSWFYTKKDGVTTVVNAEDLSHLPPEIQNFPEELRKKIQESNEQPSSKFKQAISAAHKSIMAAAEQAMRETHRLGYWARKKLTPQSTTDISFFPKQKKVYVASPAATAVWSSNSDTSTADDSAASQLSDSNSDTELSKVDIHYLEADKIETKVTVPVQNAAAQLQQLSLENSAQQKAAPDVKFAGTKASETVADKTPKLQFACSSDTDAAPEDTGTADVVVATAAAPADNNDGEKPSSTAVEEAKSSEAKGKAPKKAKVTTLHAKERYSGADIELTLTAGTSFTAYVIKAQDAEGEKAQAGVKALITKKVSASQLIAIMYNLQIEGQEELQPVEVVVEKALLTKAQVNWELCDD